MEAYSYDSTNSGQSYKASTLINYDSRVVYISNLIVLRVKSHNLQA